MITKYTKQEKSTYTQAELECNCNGISCNEKKNWKEKLRAFIWIQSFIQQQLTSTASPIKQLGITAGLAVKLQSGKDLALVMWYV